MATEQKRRARKPNDAKRDAWQRTVRASGDEGALIERAALRKALDVGSWIRMVAVEAARSQLGEP